MQINRSDASDANSSGDFTATGLAGSGTITNGGGYERLLLINTTGNNTFSGTLADGGTAALGLNKQGTGRLTLTGSSSYTGVTTVSGGILSVQGSNALGASRTVNQAAGGRNSGIELEGGFSLPASVNFTLSNDGAGAIPYALANISGHNTINGVITMTSGGGFPVVRSDAGSLTLAGSITSDQSRTLILGGASTEANIVSGVISNGTAGTNGLTKEGTGTWTLSGANTYTGATNINAGLLRVSAGGSLSGLSTTATTVASGATLSLDDDAVFTFTIGSAGVNHRLTGSGTVNLNGDFAFNFLSPVTGSESWTIVDVANLTESFGSSFTVRGFADAGNDLWVMDAGGGLAYQFSEATGTLQVVPEPGAFISLLGGLGMLLGMRRVRRPVA